MSFVSHQSTQPQASLHNSLCQNRGGLAGGHAATLQAQVNVHNDVELDVLVTSDSCHVVHNPGIVHGNDDGCLSRKFAEPPDHAFAGDFICNQNALDPVVDESLGLP